jgi:predicted transposase YbfD/YdcC
VEPVKAFAERIRGYWGVENKVHYVRDVTQGEDAR